MDELWWVVLAVNNSNNSVDESVNNSNNSHTNTSDEFFVYFFPAFTDYCFVCSLYLEFLRFLAWNNISLNQKIFYCVGTNNDLRNTSGYPVQNPYI